MNPGKLFLAPASLLCLLILPIAFAENGQERRLVSVRPFAEIALYPQRSAPATVATLNDSRLSAQIRARIDTIPVQVGDSVKKGQVLIRLDCRDYRLALTSAEAGLRLAAQQAERARDLALANAISQEFLDQREATLDTARADRDRAVLDVSRCELRAPFDGIVLERFASEGEVADPGSRLLRLMDTAGIEVSAQIPIDSAESLKAARSIHLETREGIYPLHLRTLLPVIRSEARNREARLVFTADPALPGAAGRLIWEATDPHLPADLIVRREAQLGIFVAANGTARFVALPDALEGHPASTVIPPETPVVTEGRQGLRDGDRLQVLDAR